MSTTRTFLAAAVASAAGLAGSSRANLITFDGVQGLPLLDGFSIGGVQFSYLYTGTLPPLTNPPDVVNAVTQGIYPFSVPYVDTSTPCVIGLQFATPVTDLSFLFGREGSQMLPVGVRVQLFAAGGQMLADLTAPAFPAPPVVPLAPILTGTFSASGLGAIAHVDILLEGDRSTFSFDNISFTPVPEPAAGLAFAVAGLMLRRHRKGPHAPQA